MFNDIEKEKKFKICDCFKTHSFYPRANARISCINKIVYQAVQKYFNNHRICFKWKQYSNNRAKYVGEKKDSNRNTFFLGRLVRESLNKFPDFFRIRTFIDSTHMKV